MQHQRYTASQTNCLQVLLRWELQRGASTAFKAVSPEHIKSNLEALGFQLPPEDMHALTTIAYTVSGISQFMHTSLHFICLSCKCVAKSTQQLMAVQSYDQELSAWAGVALPSWSVCKMQQNLSLISASFPMHLLAINSLVETGALHALRKVGVVKCAALRCRCASWMGRSGG